MANELQIHQARARFDNSVMRAQFADLWGRVTRHGTNLVPFQDVAQRLGARQQMPRGRQSVPLECIVGSVGRTRDFTHDFLPRHTVNRERWAGISAAYDASEGLPPVELYRIGEVFFVKDGHHRISAARANGQLEIEAHVVEVQSPIRLTVEDVRRNDWSANAKRLNQEEPTMGLIDYDLVKSEYEELLKQAELERRVPRPAGDGLGPVMHLLARLGDSLIAFGTQLKANSQSAR